jgi:DNA-binding response OmpR family regulator
MGRGAFADRGKYPLPDVVITDLKMPGMSGFQFLEWLNRHQEFRVVPTIVMSSSQDERDVALAYEMGANTYIVKPPEFETLAGLIKLIRDYWTASTRSCGRGRLKPNQAP